MYPVLFKVGSFEVPSFGVAMVVAMFASIALAKSRAKRFGLTPTQVENMAFVAILAGVIGARVVFIAQEWGYYSQHPKELFSPRFSGLTSFGGLIFGLVAAVIWAKKKGVSVLNLLDLAAPAFLVGHLIGRVGCLLNGCCFGGVCPPTVPWGITVEGSKLHHHPAQIYDSLMNLAGLGLVLGIERVRKLRAGQVTGLVLVVHGISRFVYEFWRAETEAEVHSGAASSTYWGSLPITQAQAMAAALVLLGALMFGLAPKARPLEPQPTA